MTGAMSSETYVHWFPSVSSSQRNKDGTKTTEKTFWDLQQAIFDRFEIVEEDGQFLHLDALPQKLSIGRYCVLDAYITYNKCCDNGCKGRP
jgi:hypothetical protein